jgi:hypothetical protein
MSNISCAQLKEYILNVPPKIIQKVVHLTHDFFFKFFLFKYLKIILGDFHKIRPLSHI